MSYDDVRTLVAEANRVLAEFGLSSGAVAGHGHVSMRSPRSAGPLRGQGTWGGGGRAGALEAGGDDHV